MKKPLLVIIAICISFSIISAFAEETTITTKAADGSQTTTTTTTVNTALDDAIVTAIYTKFAKDAALIGTKVTASSVDGIVTLNGTVTAQSQADEAVLVAKSISGVKDVRSNINVTTNPQTSVAPVLKPNY